MTSDNAVGSCCEIRSVGAADRPAGIQAHPLVIGRPSFEAFERLAVWLWENERRPRRGPVKDGPLRCQVTEEDSVVHTWNALASRLARGNITLSGNAKS